MPEEIRLFLRTAAFGFGIALVYWIVSGESTGTVLLLAFGLAGAFLTVVLVAQLRASGRHLTGRPWRWLGLDAEDTAPLGPEPVRYPSAGWAPLAAGLGISIAILAAVYGPVFLVLAAPLLLFAARAWLKRASAEYGAQFGADSDGG
jgi:hypothetical protein